jgi:hypothetical protein
MGKWWVTFCDRCGRWARLRPAMPWWEKREDEVEVDEDEFRKLRRSSGYVRAWYIRDQVTRLVNEHRCN